MKQALQELLITASYAIGTPIALVSVGPEGAEPTVIAASIGEDAATYDPAGGGASVSVVYAGRELALLVALDPTVELDTRLMEGFATAAGFILGNAGEMSAAREVLKESHLLHEVGAMLVGPGQLQDALTTMLRAVRRLFNADYASIATIEPDGKTRWRAMDGHRTEKYKETVFLPSRGTVARAIAAGKPIALEGIGISPDLPAEEFPIHVAEGGTSALAAPLFKGGQAIGALTLGSRTLRRWKDTERATLSVVANAAALVIEQARATTSEGSQRVFLGKVLENFPGALIVMEPPEWRVLLINSGFTALLPEPYRSGAPVIGCTAREITSEWTERSDAIMALLQKVVDTGEAVSFEQYASETPERGVIYWNWSAVPVDGAVEDGKRVVMLLAQEVTEMVLAREKERRSGERAHARAEELEAVINQMADGVSIFDAEGKVLRINPAGQRLLGRNIQMGAAPDDYPRLYGFYSLEGELLARERLTFTRALGGETVVGEQILVRRPNGQDAILSISGSPLTDSEGNISGAVLVFHDITQEKMTERLKDEFLSVVSHELRTPLSAIMGYSDLMLRGLHGTLNERQTRSLSAVRANADRLLRLINDLLDVSKLESGALIVDAHPVSLATVVSRTVAQTRVLAVNAGVNIQNNIAQGTLPKALADEMKLQQILENLLSNALKFTPSGGSVTFNAAPSPLPASDPSLSNLDPATPSETAGPVQSLIVSVTDTGAGLEEAELDRIWNRFYQVDSSAKRRSGGTGLGLAIVRSLVELHGGHAWVRSAGAGHGSSFLFSLPVASGEDLSDAAAPHSTTYWDGRDKVDNATTVLIAEDDADQREIICDMLEMEGYKVVVAADGEEALQLAQTIKPAAIALDVVLPRKDGWEVLNRLKRDPATRDIPVLIISVVDQQEFGKSLGADEYLVKPLEAASLRAVVKKLVGDERVSE